MSNDQKEDLSKNRDDYYEDDKKDTSFLRSLGGLVTFSTIIPLGIYTSIEAVISVIWLWPLLNGIIGLGGVAIAYILLKFFKMSHLLVATIVVAYIFLIMGYNHTDGLLDFSDGLMVHGDSKKKISVMRDSMVGTAGISTMVVFTVMTIAALTNIIDYNCLWGIIIAEMAAKISLLTTCVLSKPAEDGIGKYFVEDMPIPNYVASILIVGIIAYVLLGYIGIFGIIGGILAGCLISYLAKRNFGVATGDVLGTSNEIGRLLSLIFLVIALPLF
ncbi:cobalamin 5'-phosphate synthase [Methanobrevibacter sp. 87.7]|nr:cobalamin 5'-phosphate synthase [Methanobrevibacter sp. 87.7]